MPSLTDVFDQVQKQYNNIQQAWNAMKNWDPGAMGGILNPGGPNPNWTGSGLGNPNGLMYPQNLGTNEVPIGVQFVAHKYSPRTKDRFLVGDPMAEDGLATITLPLPRDFVNSTTASYKSATLTRGGLMDLNPGDLAEQTINKTGGLGAIAAYSEGLFGNLGNLVINNIWLNWLKDALKVTEFAGEYPQDLRDNIFAGMQFRTHNFSWTMVPKSASEARLIAEI